MNLHTECCTICGKECKGKYARYDFYQAFENEKDDRRYEYMLCGDCAQVVIDTLQEMLAEQWRGGNR